MYQDALPYSVSTYLHELQAWRWDRWPDAHPQAGVITRLDDWCESHVDDWAHPRMAWLAPIRAARLARALPDGWAALRNDVRGAARDIALRSLPAIGMRKLAVDGIVWDLACAWEGRALGITNTPYEQLLKLYAQGFLPAGWLCSSPSLAHIAIVPAAALQNRATQAARA